MLQRAFSPPSSWPCDHSSGRQDAGQQNPAESAGACSAQPSLNQQPQQQQKSSLISPFSHIYLASTCSGRRALTNHSNAQSDFQKPSLPFGWNAKAMKKRPRESMRHCEFNCKNSKCAWLILPAAVLILNSPQQKRERCIQSRPQRTLPLTVRVFPPHSGSQHSLTTTNHCEKRDLEWLGGNLGSPSAFSSDSNAVAFS